MKIIVIVFLIFLIINLIIILFIKYYEKKLIFFPSKEFYYTPADIGLQYNDVLIKTPDNIQLHGWYIPDNDSEKVMLFFHGNAGNISDRIEIVNFLAKLRTNILIIDYRGYGKSEGKITEKGMYIDAKSAYDFLVEEKKYSSKDIIIYGKSIGTQPAIDLASKVSAYRIIIDSSFTSSKDMSKLILPVYPSELFMKIKFNAIDKIKSIDYPKLFIQSKDDKTTPYKLGLKLYNMANEPKELLIMNGVHNSFLFENEEVITQKIKDFIK